MNRQTNGQAAQWRQIAEENLRRIEEWLTGGRPRTVRTRGAPIPSGLIWARSAPQTWVTIDDLFTWLTQDVPQAGWIVVVDGSWNEFVDRLCRQAKTFRESCYFWLVESAETTPVGEEVLVDLHSIRLNTDKPDDQQFCNNLVADLVIVPSHPADSQWERACRWLTQSYYIVLEGPTGPCSSDTMKKDYPPKQYQAPVLVAENEKFRFFYPQLSEGREGIEGFEPDVDLHN